MYRVTLFFFVPAGWWCQRHSSWFLPWCLSSGTPSWGPRMDSSRTAVAWHTCHTARCSTWLWTQLQERMKRRRDINNGVWKILNYYHWDPYSFLFLWCLLPYRKRVSSKTNIYHYANNYAAYYFWKDIWLKPALFVLWMKLNDMNLTQHTSSSHYFSF